MGGEISVHKQQDIKIVQSTYNTTNTVKWGEKKHGRLHGHVLLVRS